MSQRKTFLKFRRQVHQLALRLGNNPKLAFARLLQGILVFLFGALILIISDRVLANSLQQEMIALLGVIIAGIGIIMALFGYLSMSLLRLYHMINNKDH
ncbi:hypothetical protein OA92_02470 [Marinomonas sp. SBI22]|uniref:hypothetical protein n=1 Tax=unclassified Marinomonas TaxID=196814 RepID=UPI0007AEF32B|nr:MULTISPECIES: hypothetical protein [unclassified Marinomonas]KZM40766.1 hypothetical protein OA91_19025 [Marinomonas sp. SBI8L]KZM46050.1 hypothetical protein OA92_02470 [Marinomonas sp. SBI22]